MKVMTIKIKEIKARIFIFHLSTFNFKTWASVLEMSFLSIQ